MLSILNKKTKCNAVNYDYSSYSIMSLSILILTISQTVCKRNVDLPGKTKIFVKNIFSIIYFYSI